MHPSIKEASVLRTLIVTHHGAFHPDDVFDVAHHIVRLGLDFFSVEIERVDYQSKNIEADIITDVGGEFDGEYKFDHHQFHKGDSLYGECAFSLSTEAFNNPLSIDASLIEAVKQRDTRVNYNPSNKHEPLLQSIADCNGVDINHNEDQLLKFKELVALTIPFLKGEKSYEKFKEEVDAISTPLKKIKEEIEAKVISTLKVEKYIDGIPLYVTEGDRFFNIFNSHLKEKPYINRFFNNSKGEYTFRTNTDFCTIGELEGAIFIHPNGFMGVTNIKNPKIKIKIKRIKDGK